MIKTMSIDMLKLHSLQMINVATSTPCGHTFCRQCISRCLESNFTTCPVCKQEISKRQLYGSTSIDRIASEFKELRAAYERESGNGND
ncbi:hypothetical protein BX666DRAFT_1887093 [Dichotomocladium elegans]|nr:hypothetical protein BX666DRAFT_1887093 [Dichotomocladium elegans]